MAYADLTTEQKATLDSWLNNVRGICGEMARVGNHCAAADTAYWAQISAILAGLADSDLVPNASGLAGAQSLTKAQIVTLVSHIEAVNTLNDSNHRNVWVLACGMTNLIG